MTRVFGSIGRTSARQSVWNEAREAKRPRYFDGVPCLRGHTSERYTANGTCVECAIVHNSKYAKTDRNKRRERNYGMEHRIKKRAQSYKLSVAQYNQMLHDQWGACAICRKVFGTGWRDGPHIDHDHATGVVRKLLCVNCNRGLGFFGDDVYRIGAALTYLRPVTVPAGTFSCIGG